MRVTSRSQRASDERKFAITASITTQGKGLYPSWLDLTRNIAIELHGKAAEDSFQRALRSYDYERRQADELTVIYGLRRASASRRSSHSHPKILSSGRAIQQGACAPLLQIPDPKFRLVTRS